MNTIDRPPKIIFVIPSYAVGGMELQLASLIANRPQWAHDYELQTTTLLPPRSTEIAERYDLLGVQNTLVNRQELAFPAFLFRLIKHFKKESPAIVHALLDSSAGAWGRLAAVLAGVPSIIQSDRSIEVSGTRSHRLFRPFLDRRTARFLPNAHAIAERISNAGVDSKRITVIPSAVDLHRFRPSPLGNREANELVAGFVGRFDPVKRLDILLEALMRVEPHSRPGKVILVGDGPEMENVKSIIANEPWLRKHVELLGRQSDVPAILNGVDYLVHSSEVEGAPNAVIEAMAMGRPVVATRVSDVPRIVGDTGILANPGDVESLANAISRMQILSAGKRKELGERAREKIKREYDIVPIAELFWEAHRALLPDLPDEETPRF